MCSCRCFCASSWSLLMAPGRCLTSTDIYSNYYLSLTHIGLPWRKNPSKGFFILLPSTDSVPLKNFEVKPVHLYYFQNPNIEWLLHRAHCNIVIVLQSDGPHVTEKGGTTDPATEAIEYQAEWLLHTSALHCQTRAEGRTGAPVLC